MSNTQHMAISRAHFLRRLFFFPLVGRELRELASNRRTYINRIIFVSLSIILFLIVSGKHLMGGSISALGRGRDFYESILMMQFFYVYLIVPIVVSGVITIEKERESLSLLFLTELRGGEIIFEKYLSSLLPVIFFLMSFLPITIMSYLMGGTTVEKIIETQWCVLTALFLNASIALFCSSYSSSSVGSMFSSLILTLLTAFFPVLLDIFLGFHLKEEYALLLFPPFRANISPYHTYSLPWYFSSIAVGILSIVYLKGARFFLYRRAFGQSRKPLSELLWFIHRMFERIDKKFFKRKAALKTPISGEHPIVWKEWARRSAFAPRALTRLATVGGLVAFAIMTFNVGDYYNGQLFLFWLVSWTVYLVLIFALSINLISDEKKKQSLEVLLTTPITRKEIFKQKFRSLLVTNNICGLVVFVNSISIWFLSSFNRRTHSSIYVVVLSALLAIIIYPRLIMLVATLSSCIAKSAPKATIMATTILFGWVVAFSTLCYFLEEFVGYPSSQASNFFYCIIPGHLVLEVINYESINPVLIFIHFGFYGGIMGLMYFYIYRHADSLLNRSPRG